MVGAGVAGCAAAVLLARRGVRVLLLDRKRSPDDYKRTCTTYIQAGALPAIRRLGLDAVLEELGAVRNRADFWTAFGWMRDPGRRPAAHAHGYTVQRRKLDPALMRLAAREDTLRIVLGARMTALLPGPGGALTGVAYRDADGAARRAQARLLVLADGRHSQAARLAGVPTRSYLNGRFAVFAHYRDLKLPGSGAAQYWLTGRDMAFAYPCDDGLTLLCGFLTQDRADAARAAPQATLEALFDGLPGAPVPAAGQPVSRVVTVNRLRDHLRPSCHRGLALVGDACMALDPASGVGCGFALQSADLLDVQVGPALAAGRPTARGLAGYARAHARTLGRHAHFIQDAATGRGQSWLERAASRAAVADPAVAGELHLFMSRAIDWRRFLRPANAWRILRANWIYARRAGQLRGAP